MACLPHVGQGVAISVSIQRIFGGSENIIEQHGGEISFESQPGQRTVFSFSIPERPLVSPSLQPIAATIH